VAANLIAPATLAESGGPATKGEAFVTGGKLATAAALVALTPASAQAQQATAVRTDANTVELTVRVKAKRPLERRLFAEPCGLPDSVLFCDAQELSKKVRLHKGRNTVKLKVQRLRLYFVGTNVTGIPWDGYALVPAPVDAIWWRFGQGRARQVMPSPVAHDTLRDAK
jgi:hypothetical protein